MVEQFDEYKRATYGYYLNFIRVDLYNKIILKAVLKGKRNSIYESYNLENRLKNELQNENYKHYFNTYFEMRLNFYNKFFPKYNYDINQTIDLIYQYRNFLLDDSSRLDVKKLDLIEGKSIIQKEEDIQRIILLLLSENILEEYANIYDNGNKIMKYQKFYYSNNIEIITYRKYLAKYFGVNQVTKKISYLQRFLNNQKISYVKRFQMIIILLTNRDNLTQLERDTLLNLDLKINKDYLKETYGLLRVDIPVSDYSSMLINDSQFFILYLLKKHNEEYSLDEFLNFLLKQGNLKVNEHNQIIVATRHIYMFAKKYFDSLFQNRHLKNILKRPIKINDSSILLKFMYYKRMSDLKVKKKNINNDYLLNSYVALELIEEKYIKSNVNKSIENYLMSFYKNLSQKKEILFGILNQMKFTMEVKEFEKIKTFSTKEMLSLQRDYKRNKKGIITSYIKCMYILIHLRVHKYNEEVKYKDIYIYRNKIMHFQKNLVFDSKNKSVILKEIKTLQKVENVFIEKNIVFDDRFFNLLVVEKMDFEFLKMSFLC